MTLPLSIHHAVIDEWHNDVMTSKYDRLELLSTFNRIAERRSISLAAEDQGIAIATASRHLKYLEQLCRADLVHRSTHGLVLTSAGEQVLSSARGILDQWFRATDSLHSQNEAPSGELSIVVPDCLGQGALADAITLFTQKYPNVTIKWKLHNGVVKFSETGCDLWITNSAVGDDTLRVKSIAKIEQILVVSPAFLREYPLTSILQIEQLPFVALEPFPSNSVNLFNNSGESLSVNIEPKIVTNNIVSMHRFLCSGLGVGVTPKWFVSNDLTLGRLRRLYPEWHIEPITLKLAYQPSRYLSASAKAFINLIETTMTNIIGIKPVVELEKGITVEKPDIGTPIGKIPEEATIPPPPEVSNYRVDLSKTELPLLQQL